MLIGITGKKRSGKDTAGDYLVSTYGFKKARPLAVFKSSFKDWFGWTDEHMEGNLKEVVDPMFGFSPRQLMQVFGTELMKNDLKFHLPEFEKTCGDDIWARAFVRWYRQQPEGNYVVTDLRFLNESRILPLDVIIRMKSDRSPEDSHISENEIGLIAADYEIVNNNYGSFSVVYDALDQIMKDCGVQKVDKQLELFEE